MRYVVHGMDRCMDFKRQRHANVFGDLTIYNNNNNNTPSSAWWVGGGQEHFHRDGRVNRMLVSPWRGGWGNLSRTYSNSLRRRRLLHDVYNIMVMWSWRYRRLQGGKRSRALCDELVRRERFPNGRAILSRRRVSGIRNGGGEWRGGIYTSSPIAVIIKRGENHYSADSVS